MQDLIPADHEEGSPEEIRPLNHQDRADLRSAFPDDPAIATPTTPRQRAALFRFRASDIPLAIEERDAAVRASSPTTPIKRDDPDISPAQKAAEIQQEKEEQRRRNHALAIMSQVVRNRLSDKASVDPNTDLFNMQQTLADFLPIRVRYVYRLVRENGRQRKLFANPTDTLADLLDPESPAFFSFPNELSPNAPTPSAYTTPVPLKLSFGNETAYTDRKIIRHLREAADKRIWLPEEYQDRFEDFDEEVRDPETGGAFRKQGRRPIGIPGHALCPPEVPFKYLDPLSLDILPTYRPTNDKRLLHFIELQKMMAESLGMFKGVKDNPKEGEQGLGGILDPYLIRVAWPTLRQLLDFEQAQIEAVKESLVIDGSAITHANLRNNFGYTDDEIRFWCAAARRQAKYQTEGSVEENRGIMLLRLESICKRARVQLDLRAEIAALKMVVAVQGLVDLDGEEGEFEADFMKVVGKYATKPGAITARDGTSVLPAGPSPTRQQAG